MTETGIWNPGRLNALVRSYWQASAVHSALKLGLTQRLARAGDTPLSPARAASELGLSERGTRLLLEALAALEVAVKEDGGFVLHPDIRPFLTPGGKQDMSNLVMHHVDLYPVWGELADCVASGKPHPRKDEQGKSPNRSHFYRAMRDLSRLKAKGLAARLGLAGGMRVLDMGGGPGVYALTFADEIPGLDAVVYDLAGARPFFEEESAMHPAADRVSFLEGDYEREGSGVGGPYDLVWVSHTLHGQSPEVCQHMIDIAAGALKPGGALWVQEFVLNDQRTGPTSSVLFSLNMLINTQGGQSYSRAEVAAMMTRAGLRDPEEMGIIQEGDQSRLMRGFKP